MKQVRNTDGLTADEVIYQHWHGAPFVGDPAMTKGFHRWYPSDTERYYKPEGNLYKPEDFGYTFNSQGFRCDEFDDAEYDLKVVFVGCSFTMGVGLPSEHSYPGLIVQALRDRGLTVPLWNLAIGGYSTDFCVRTLYRALPVLKPDLVVALFPNMHRRELFIPTVSDPWQFLPYMNVEYLCLTSKTAQSFVHVLSPENDALHAAQNYAFFETLMGRYGCEYAWNCWRWDHWQQADLLVSDTMRANRFDFKLDDTGDGTIQFARDSMHFGPRHHALFAERLLKEVLDSKINAILDRKGSGMVK